MTEQRLVRLATLWQKRLRLQDWHVTVSLVDSLPESDTVGKTEVDRREKQADVSILNTDNERNDENLEKDLIHELLHLLLVDWDQPDIYDWPPREIAINLLADNFYRAYH